MTKKTEKKRIEPATVTTSKAVNHEEFEVSVRAFFESRRGKAVQRLCKRFIARNKTHGRKIPNDRTVRFLGPSLQFSFDLFPGLQDLVETAAGQRMAGTIYPGEELAASREALQQIADGAVGFFHAVTYFAGLGHPWAVRILAEFAVASTSVVEGAIRNRPMAPIKAVPLWPSPGDRKKNDAHTLRPDCAFAALLQFFRNRLPTRVTGLDTAQREGIQRGEADAAGGCGAWERVEREGQQEEAAECPKSVQPVVGPLPRRYQPK